MFGLFAGITYWFPKAFGFKLDPFWGKCSFWFWVVGFYVAFMPLYMLGLMGVTRRLQPLRRPVAADLVPDRRLRRVLIALGIAGFLIQLVVSFLQPRRSCATRPATPGTAARSNGRPPRRRRAYNFAFTPIVHDLDAWWDMKKRGYARPRDGFMPDPHAEEHRRRLRPRRAEQRSAASR